MWQSTAKTRKCLTLQRSQSLSSGVRHLNNNIYQEDNYTDPDDDDLSSLLQNLNIQHDSKDESDRESQQPGIAYASFDTSELILDSGCS